MHVLGINYSNDAAAALVRDGHVVAACQEERFRRVKHYAGFPEQAVRWCLEEGGITMDDVDHVGFFWNPGIHAEAFHRASASVRHHQEFLFDVPNYLLNRFLNGRPVRHVRQQIALDGKTLDIHYCTHHLTHAAATFYRSNFDEAAILLVDGYGERAATTIATGRGTTIETLHTIDFPHSVGSLYAAFTQYLGFRANNGEGKVMGLASYGEPGNPYVQTVRDLVTLTDDGFELDLSYFSYFLERTRRYQPKLQARLGPERRAGDPLDQRHFDIAYALQKTTEEVLLHLARITKAKTGLSRLCMAGGVVLNCVANARIQREVGFEQCYFMPCSSDAGTSLGAALMVAHAQGAARIEHPMTDYLGPRFDNDKIETTLKKGGVPYTPLTTLQNTADAAAEAIASGQIIGWFQGRAEFGPRSLGNRSILCDPGRADMKDVLNARVKFREAFRPFAPSIVEEASGTYFDDGGVPSPFMLLVYDTRPEHVQTLPAVTHVDGGARVQTVTRDQNERYYRLIEAVGRRTGVPCVVNTSFNIRGEPIVNSPDDALKCFFTTDMDKLFLGDFLIEKATS